MINFQKYDEENPRIWQLFQTFAREAKDRGFRHYSVNGIFELIRWHTRESGNDGYKVNNNYRPDYARKMMEQYPEFQGFFRTREMKAKRVKQETI